jgi:hypothetical protein
LNYEKALKITEKSLIPAGIIESDKSLQSYLEENVIANQKDEKIRLRIARTKNTWINKRLEAAARKITVEPTDAASIKQQQTIRRLCKKVDKPVTEEPREGTLVTEVIKGIIVVCDFCGHRWTHHSQNLGRQYYTQCGICRRNVRLKHYRVGK